MILAWPMLSRPKPLQAGLVGVLVNLERPKGGRQIGLLTTALFDGEPARFIACYRLPEFGAILPEDHGRRAIRIGDGVDSFVQFESRDQRAERWSRLSPCAAERFAARLAALEVTSKESS